VTKFRRRQPGLFCFLGGRDEDVIAIPGQATDTSRGERPSPVKPARTSPVSPGLQRRLPAAGFTAQSARSDRQVGPGAVVGVIRDVGGGRFGGR